MRSAPEGRAPPPLRARTPPWVGIEKLGYGVEDSGFRVRGLECGAWDLGFEVRVEEHLSPPSLTAAPHAS